MALPSLLPALELSIRERIRAELDFDRKADDERIAERILRAIDKDDLLPLLAQEVGRVRREHVRRVEQNVLPALMERFQSRPRSRVTAEERKRMLVALTPAKVYALRRSPLDLGDGTTVTWGKATAEQLKRRLHMLRQQARGVAATIETLEAVIKELEHSGVSCLDELAV